jgi:glucose/mannose-6-phosphate isomerase
MIRKVLDLPLQCRDARERVRKAPPRLDVRGVDSVLVTGLGGSAIGGDVLRSVVWRKACVAVSVNRHYLLPAWVGRGTLVVCSSYSGDTEETLSAFADAVRRRARILVISSGGRLTREARRRRIPVCAVPPGYPPRSAFGYSFVTLLSSLEALGLLAPQGRDFEEAMSRMERMSAELAPGVPSSRNEAKRIAAFLHGRLPIVYAGQDHMDAVGLRWRGQLNENAKQVALGNVLPEMNHNEVVGFTLPGPLLRRSAVVLLRDPKGDHPQVSRRFEALRAILRGRVAGVREVRARGRSVLSRVLTALYLGDFVSVYLAYLRRVDPTPVEVIDRLKKTLAGR